MLLTAFAPAKLPSGDWVVDLYEITGQSLVRFGAARGEYPVDAIDAAVALLERAEREQGATVDPNLPYWLDHNWGEA